MRLLALAILLALAAWRLRRVPLHDDTDWLDERLRPLRVGGLL